MKFIDEVEIEVFGGDGGAGMVSWRREKFVPRGGPDGGDGGSGGAIVFEVDSGKHTLLDLSFKPQLKAESGSSGEPSRRHGKSGTDLIQLLPPGTQVFFGDKLVADLKLPGSRWIAARGGRGGKGNAAFATSTRTSPDFAQPGLPGEHFRFRLVLKSVADVGLIGFPNVGKSSLLSKLTEAHPLVADYPFTTLSPNLGVCKLDNDRRFVIADIPGLIPDAHSGKGLGINFLKHIERTAVLAQVIDISDTLAKHENHDDELIKKLVNVQFNAVETELQLFNAELIKLPRLIVFSKSDLSHAKRAFSLCKNDFEQNGFQSLLVSSQTGEGMLELKEALYKLIKKNA